MCFLVVLTTPPLYLPHGDRGSPGQFFCPFGHFLTDRFVALASHYALKWLRKAGLRPAFLACPELAFGQLWTVGEGKLLTVLIVLLFVESQNVWGLHVNFFFEEK